MSADDENPLNDPAMARITALTAAYVSLARLLADKGVIDRYVLAEDLASTQGGMTDLGYTGAAQFLDVIATLVKGD